MMITSTTKYQMRFSKSQSPWNYPVQIVITKLFSTITWTIKTSFTEWLLHFDFILILFFFISTRRNEFNKMSNCKFIDKLRKASICEKDNTATWGTWIEIACLKFKATVESDGLHDGDSDGYNGLKLYRQRDRVLWRVLRAIQWPTRDLHRTDRVFSDPSRWRCWKRCACSHHPSKRQYEKCTKYLCTVACYWWPDGNQFFIIIVYIFKNCFQTFLRHSYIDKTSSPTKTNYFLIKRIVSLLNWLSKY